MQGLNIKKNKLSELLVFFKKYLNKDLKFKLLTIILLTTFNGFFEILGFAFLVPFLSFLNDSTIQDSSQLSFFLNLFSLRQSENLVFLFILISLLSFCLSIIISYLINFYIHKLGYDFNIFFGKKLIKKYLDNSNSLVEHNTSSELINKITHETSKLCEMFTSLIHFISKTIFLFITIIILSYLKPKIFFVIFIIILFYYFIFRLLKNNIIKLSNELTISQKKIIGISSEIIEAFREIRLLGIKEKIFNKYTFYKERYEKNYLYNTFFSSFPKVLLEFLIIFLLFIATLIFFLNYNLDTYKGYVFELSILIVILIRLNPIANVLYQNIHVINKFSNVIKIFSNDLSKEKIQKILKINKNKKLKIKKIILKNLSFDYLNSKNKLLSKINMNFEKGEFTGIIGSSGSGKSTIADIITNFIKIKNSNNSHIKYLNEEGKLLSSNEAISEILLLSQRTFLFNESILENITQKKIINKDEDINFIKAMKLANMEKFIKFKKRQYKGEISNKFSGGELQRLALARALYQEKDVIIFDESLSSLNKENQIQIMKELQKIKKNKILIMITHDINLNKFFDKIYQLENGNIKKLDKN